MKIFLIVLYIVGFLITYCLLRNFEEELLFVDFFFSILWPVTLIAAILYGIIHCVLEVFDNIMEWIVKKIFRRR